MSRFIEITELNGNKAMINVDTIECIAVADGIVGIIIGGRGMVVKETYEDLKAMI